MREMSLDEVKNCTLDILKWVKVFCSEHNITWWLCGGTLLGAARHKGFIPWDDDIDIMLPREEYEKLFRLFPQNSRYRFLTSDNTDDLPYAYGKIIDTKTIKMEPLPQRYQKIGVDIDVFPIDNFPENIDDSISLCNKISYCQRKLQRLFALFGKRNTFIKTIGYNLVSLPCVILRESGILDISKYTHEIQELSQKYNKEETGFKGILTIAHYGIKEKNEALVYAQTVNVEFEGCEYPAPIGFRTYLKNLYGDNYMLLPPIEKRVTHHSYKAYWKD